MKEKKQCYLIGRTSLMIRCLKILLEKSWTILGVISTDPDVHAFLEANKLKQITFDQFINKKKGSFDYLFSIVNNRILKLFTLSLPKIGTINFHDSLLPNYAGVHATSWAILNGESIHGVTWHLVDEGVDTGDILLQEKMPIYDDDSAYTLSARCFEKGTELFVKLIDGLDKNLLKPKPQFLSHRTYYPFHKRPIINTWIDGKSSAENIERLFRSCYFGHYRNDFSSLKCFLKNKIFIIDRLKKLTTSSSLEAGRIVKKTEEGIIVSTKTGDICLERLWTEETGYLASDVLRSYLEENHIKVLDPISSSKRKRLTRLSETCFKHENFWIKEIKSAKLATFPFKDKQYTPSEESKPLFTLLEWSFPDELIIPLQKKFLNISFDIILFSLLIIHLKIINQESFLSVGLNLIKKSTLCHNIVTNIYPLNISIISDSTFAEVVNQLIQKYSMLTKMGFILNDLFYRYTISPSFKKVSCSKDFTPIIFSLSDTLDKNISSSLLIAHIIKKTRKIIWQIPRYCFLRENHLDRVKEQILNIIQQVTENIRLPLKDISILSFQELKLFKAWNQTDKFFPKKENLYDLFIKQARTYPHKIAIVYKTRRVTYEKIAKMSYLFSETLKKRKIDAEKLVGIYITNSIEAIVSILSLLRLGVAYVPLDPNYPAERIDYIIKQSELSYILTIDKNEKKLKALTALSKKIQIIFINLKVSKVINRNYLKSCEANSNQLAYVLYTSGSTGQPKGVGVRQVSIINLIYAQTDTFKINKESRILGFASLNFDASVSEIFSALMNGATLIVAPHHRKFSADSLIDLFIKESINTATLPPSLLKNISFPDGFKLKTLISAGEKCSSEIIRKHFPHCLQFINAYGPTETTVCATLNICQSIKDVNIGKPICNTKVYVLNQQLKTQPTGIIGELYIGGVGVSTGYWKQLKLTKEKFFKTPFSRNKLYRTGDLVYWLPSGKLVYFGRIDRQVKINGFRIEIEEIERQLKKHPHIVNTVITTLQDFQKHIRLCAYCISNSKSLSAQCLRKYLEKILPSFMIPNNFIFLDKIPLTLNGKVDFENLKKIHPEKRAIKNSIEENSIEKKVILLWSKLLHLPFNEITLNNNFSSLGGDSLLTLRMMNEVKNTFDTNVDYHILRYQSLEKLISLIINNKKKYKKNNENQSITSDMKKLIFTNNLSKYKKQGLHHKNILLTGANGFLGIHLLKELLKQTDAKIYCLIRDREIIARTRLYQAASLYHISLNKYIKRIEVVAGDFSRKNFGINIKYFKILSEKIDVIYHCGSWVNHLYSYNILRSSNVIGTFEIIKFALNRKNKPIYYISTLTTLNSSGLLKKRIETDILNTQIGYIQTKLASEWILTQHIAKGLKILIFRPTLLVNKKKIFLEFPKNNHLKSLLIFCKELRKIPSWNIKVNVLSIEEASSAIVKLSLKSKMNRAYPIANIHEVNWIDIVDLIRKNTTNLETISINSWYDLIANPTIKLPNFDLLPLYKSVETNQRMFPLISSPKINLEELMDIKRMIGKNFSRINADQIVRSCLKDNFKSFIENFVYIAIIPLYYTKQSSYYGLMGKIFFLVKRRY